VSLIRRITTENILAVSQELWNDKSLASKITLEAMSIVNQTYRRKHSFYNGRSSRYVIGGLLYLLGFRYNEIKRQNEIASILRTCDVTVRSSYRKWLETFPDLFMDVFGKLISDKDRRTYVLLNLQTFPLQSESIKHSNLIGTESEQKFYEETIEYDIK
jgi:hypothetical protein